MYAFNTADSSSRTDHFWQLAAQEQATLEQRGIIVHDESLASYLQAVTQRLWRQVKTDLKAPIIEVLMDTGLDAYAYPNGHIFLTSGILDQIENEDQLAMILAHEMVHYVRQHTAALYRHFQNPVHNTGLARPEDSHVVTAKDMQQKIDLAEDQADSEGLSILKDAGYCEAEVLTLMANLMDRINDHGTPEALKNMGNRKQFFSALIDPDQGRPFCASAGDGDPVFFLNCIAPALIVNAQAALRCGDWNQADRSISKFMAVKPDDARAYYLRGEVMRRRNDGGRSGLCLGAYKEALKIDPMFPMVHRALGELHFKAGRFQQARPYFEAFLSLAPQDEARAYIKGYLRQCQN